MSHKILGIISLSLFGFSVLCIPFIDFFNLVDSPAYLLMALGILSMVLCGLFLIAWVVTGIRKMKAVPSQPYSLAEKIVAFLIVCMVSWVAFNVYR